MTVYIVAVKREHRGDAPAGWIETLRATPGVEVAAAGHGPTERRRVRVRATTSGVTALRERVGTFCHIEPVTPHREAADVSPVPPVDAPAAATPPTPPTDTAAGESAAADVLDPSSPSADAPRPADSSTSSVDVAATSAAEHGSSTSRTGGTGRHRAPTRRTPRD